MNQKLVEAGYTPDEYEIGTEDDWAGPGSLGAGIGEPTGRFGIMYTTPDGKRVLTEAQGQAQALALAELDGEAADSLLAEAEHSAELERRSFEFGQAKDIVMENPEVEAFAARWTRTAALEWHPGKMDTIAQTSRNGVRCWRTVRDSFDGETVRYWCEDPEAAGLRIQVEDGLSTTLNDFWR